MIFVIVAVLLLGLVFLYLLNSNVEPSVPAEADTLEGFVTGALHQTAEHCLVTLGLRGGRMQPEHAASYSFVAAGLAYQNAPVFPSLEALTNELASCVESRLLSCHANLATLEQFGDDISVGQPQVTSIAGERDVRVSLYLPVTIATPNGHRTVDQFATTIPLRLTQLHGMTEREAIQRSSYEQAGDFDLTYLGQQSTNTTIIGSAESQLMVLADHHSRIRTGSYLFLSASVMGE